MATLLKSGLTIEPLDAPLGARVSGIDLAQPLDAATIKTLTDAWHDHLVLLFPGQDVTEEEELCFAANFGKLGTRSRKADARPEGADYHAGVMLVGNIKDEQGNYAASLPDGEMYFHHDMCYMPKPHKGTMLYALEVPSTGGNTLFANLYKAYETLPADLKERLRNVEAQHGYYAGRHVTPEILKSLSIERVSDNWAHPVFTSHEETSRTVLYVSRLLTQALRGLSEDEGDDILDQLLDHVEKPELVYEHVWLPGDFVIWDNRCLNHARTDFSAGETRLLRRTTVQGVRPDAAIAAVR